MSLINISSLTFAYDGTYDNIFENVSFQIDTDWKLGFTGRNGRGKTTFLNLLLGKYEYSGSISSLAQFLYFPFAVDDTSQNTLDIIEGMNPLIVQWELMRELSLLEVDAEVLYRPFSTLSFGERTKIMLAALFLKENSFLLIDEPTNHLDTHARLVVSQYLQRQHGFILVSHDRLFLDSCIDHVLSINKTNIEIQQGNFSSWYYNKQLQDNFELAQNERLKSDIVRLNAAAKRTAEWSNKAESKKIGIIPGKIEKSLGRRATEGEKSRKAMKRSKSIQARQQSAIDEKSELLKNIESADSLKITALNYHKNRLIEFEDVTCRYGKQTACEHVSFFINKGERVHISGKNGCGKSTILKLIMGENINFTGKMEIGSQLKISYVSQDTSHLVGALKSYALGYGIDESLFKSILRKLDFSRVQFEKNMSDFSEGQKKKVLIARSLCEHAHLYIWDEPLNFIDIFSRIQIEQLLLNSDITLIFVEHDTAFSENIATKVVLL